MPSPFPGMDPYIENPELWRSFHHHLAEEIARQLNPRITPKYFADVEVVTSLQDVGIGLEHTIYPDTSVLEVSPHLAMLTSPVAVLTAPIQRIVDVPSATKLRAVQIHETGTKRLVTSIEILSPFNKIGSGLRTYQQKRMRILRSDVHLIEIDLLRRGTRPGAELSDPPLDTDYIVLVNRVAVGNQRVSEIWPIAIQDKLPDVPVPLVAPDPDIVLSLAVTIQNIYRDFHYDLRIDYSQPVPVPKLRPAMQTWLTQQRQKFSQNGHTT